MSDVQYVDTVVLYRIQDLELAVDRMRQQQENLQKRLKDENDKKGKLEVTLFMYMIVVNSVKNLESLIFSSYRSCNKYG